MAQYRKFSAAPKNEVQGNSAPKVPKPPKAEPAPEETLGTLAALGGVGPEAVNSLPRDPDQEKRAAIIAEGAGVPQAWSEGYAALVTMPPPTGFSSERWQRVVRASGKLLARWGT